jgi:hypothetical protein
MRFRASRAIGLLVLVALLMGHWDLS